MVKGLFHLFTPTMRSEPPLEASFARTLRLVATPVERTRKTSLVAVGPLAAFTVKFTGAEEAELVWLSVATAVTE